MKVGAFSGTFRDELIQDLNSYISSTIKLQNQWKIDQEELRRVAQQNKDENNARISKQYSLFGAIAGGILGFFAGGPPGAAAGATAGGGLGYYAST